MPRCPRSGRRSPPTSWSRSTSARQASPSSTTTATRSSTKTATRSPVRRRPPARSSSGSPPPGAGGARTNGYFATADDARAFEDELAYMLLHQMAAPNSPQWFNTGLNHVYGITGPPQGFWYVDPETEEMPCPPPTRTPGLHPTPASSRPSTTTWSTRAASWTCGCVRPGCSSSAPAPARTSRTSAPKASRCPVAASRRA